MLHKGKKILVQLCFLSVPLVLWFNTHVHNLIAQLCTMHKMINYACWMKCSWNKTWQNKGSSNTYLWKQKIWKQKAVHDMASAQQGSWDWNRSLQHPGVPLLSTVVLSNGRVLLYLENYNEIKCNRVFLFDKWVHQ